MFAAAVYSVLVLSGDNVVSPTGGMLDRNFGRTNTAFQLPQLDQALLVVVVVGVVGAPDWVSWCS